MIYTSQKGTVSCIQWASKSFSYGIRRLSSYTTQSCLAVPTRQLLPHRTSLWWSREDQRATTWTCEPCKQCPHALPLCQQQSLSFIDTYKCTGESGICMLLGTGEQCYSEHLLHCFKEVKEEQEKEHESSLHFRIFFDLPDHQLHASSGILTGVVPFHWEWKTNASGHRRERLPSLCPNAQTLEYVQVVQFILDSRKGNCEFADSEFPAVTPQASLQIIPTQAVVSRMLQRNKAVECQFFCTKSSRSLQPAMPGTKFHT